MTYDLIIIGSGPAGYVAAIRAGQTGLKTLIIDKKYVGGMCLNWGCIPTKNVLESAKLYARIKNGAAEFGIGGYNPDELTFDWARALKRNDKIVAKLTRGVEYLWKKNGVEFLKAEANILSANEVEADNRIFSTKYILIATGSKPAPQDVFPQVIEIEDFFNMESLPQKPLLLGRGATMIEFAQLFTLLGRTPTLVYTKLPLVPVLDAYLEAWVQKKLKKDKVLSIAQEELTFVDGKAYQGDKPLDYDAVINCSRRVAILPAIKLELKLANGSIVTDEYFRTSIPNIFAAGDVNGKSYLAHASSAQGNRVIDFINGDNNVEPVNYPINIYSYPELAQIGVTEQELKAKGTEYQSREFSLAANGKALAEGASEGFIRLLFEPKYQQVLGVQIVSANATDLIAEAGLLMELEGTVYDLAKTVHAHPTIAEIFMDVAQE